MISSKFIYGLLLILVYPSTEPERPSSEGGLAWKMEIFRDELDEFEVSSLNVTGT